MKASIMLPTFWDDKSGPERLANLKLVVGALYKQTEPDFELVAVVDGPADCPTMKYLEGVARRAKFPVQLLNRDRAGIRIASARNLALNAAKGDVAIGIQDNLLVGPKFVEAHLTIHREMVVDTFVIGLACDDPARLETDHRYARGLCIGKEWFDAWARNFSVTTAAAKLAGGYDEAFDGEWGHEDVEFAFRLLKADVKFVYGTAPEIVGQRLPNTDQPRSAASLRRQANIFHRKHGFWI
jgi:hypothetical protein